jgi:hypothetical protein
MCARTSASKLLVISLFVLRVAIQARGLEPEDVLFFKTGPFSLRPQMSVSEVYNDNIFYQAEDPVEDLTTILSPGLKLQLGRPEHNYISLTYTFDQLFYVDNSELNAPQHTVELANQFELQRLKLVGTDRFQLLTSPLGGVVEQVIGPGGVATTLGRNVERTSFDDNYTLSYDLGEKTGVYLRGAHTSSDYEQGIALYDIETFSGTGGFGYRAFPKTVFFGEVYYGQTTTDPNDVSLPSNPRLDFVGGYVGVRGNFTAKLSGMVKAGYESRQFADDSGGSSDPVVDAGLIQKFSEKQWLSLSYTRLSNVSIQYSRQNYTTDTISLNFSQILGPSRKWRVNLGGSYALYAYEQTGTSSGSVEYNYARASFSLGYQVQRWLTALVGYDFEHVMGDSSAVIDYDVNRVTLRLAIGY